MKNPRTAGERKKRLCAFLLFILHSSLLTSPVQAQESGTFLDNLRSLRVQVNGQWENDPVMVLGGSNYVLICFDDLRHDYVRYTYTLTHCNADWSPSDLLESEYMDGFNGQRIEQYEQSTHTAMLYNHYTLTLPNDDIRQLRVSGNYRVDIFEDGDDEPVATACFAVCEGRVGISFDITGNTDIDTYRSHQQVNFNVNYSAYPLVRQAETDLKVVIVQNRRWDNCVRDIFPTYLRNHELVYTHNRQLIFDAGNEYRRMEILDDHVPTMHVDAMDYLDPYYHAYIMADEQRTSYVYDQDQDGRYYVRNGDDVDNETESEYYITHFALQMPAAAGGDFYLNGELTNNRLSEEFRMEYNLIEHQYELFLPLKQGSYNYQYLFVKEGDSKGSTAQAEGNFHQTENEYAVYVYHRAFGERYDRLVGYNKEKHKGNK